MHYQLTKALPYFIQRWILFRKNARLEPLYHFDSNTNQDRVEAMYAADRMRAERKEGSGRDMQIEDHTSDSVDEIHEKN
jgi:hypothetical protein